VIGLGGEFFVEHRAGLFAAHLLTDSIECTVLRQTLTQCLKRFTRLEGEHKKLTVDIALADFNLLCICNAIENERCTDLAERFITLRSAQAIEVKFAHLLCRHTLLCKCTKTAVQPGDGQAYETLVKAGMRERSTYKPLGCCLDTALLPVADGGAASQFDHKVDHIMTRDPKQVKEVNSSVTGRSPQNGFWDSDHAGLFSTLKIY